MGRGRFPLGVAARTARPSERWNRRIAFETLEPRTFLSASSYYVDPAGLGGAPSDSNPGTISQPLATLQAAVGRAGPGDTVLLRQGTYRPLANGAWSITHGGTSGAPLTIRAAAGEQPVIDLAEWYHWQQDSRGWWFVDLPSNSLVAAYPDVCVEIRNGWAASRILGPSVGGAPPANFTQPPAVYYQGGKLAYDLTWYDQASRRLWFRSNEIQPVANPDADAGVVSPASQLHVAGASWVVLDGLTVQNGWFGIHLDSGDHNIVRNSRVEHMWSQGIAVFTSYSEIANNYVDAIGGQLSDKGALGIRRDWLYHSLYVGGQGFNIHDNFFGRALSGQSVDLFLDNDATSTTVFQNNVAYGSAESQLCIEGSNLTATNNVLIGPQLTWRGGVPDALYANATTQGLYFYHPQGNMTVSGNYVEGAGYGVLALAADGQTVPQSVLANSTLVGGTGGAYLAGAPAAMSGNQWGGRSFFYVSNAKMSYADFLAWARGKGLEKQSAGRAAQPGLLVDGPAYNSLLDSAPSLDQVLAIFRAYAVGQINNLAGYAAVGDPTALAAVTMPAAADDAYTVNTGMTLSLDAARGVLANDTLPGGPTLTASLVSGPANGQLVLGADGSLTYTPSAGFIGGDSFTYQADDGRGGTAVASVTLTVADAGRIEGTNGNDMIRIVRDGSDPTRVDVFINNPGPVPTRSLALADLSQWHAVGSQGKDQWIVDFSQGDPLPSGGLLFDSGNDAADDALVVRGTGGGESVLVTAAQATVNGSAPIRYGNIGVFAFDLGTGADSLTVDGAAVRTDRDGAISAGTAVEVRGGGLLDLGGRSDTIAALTLTSGIVGNGALVSGAYAVQRGILSANLAGPGGLTKSGPDTVVLLGTNSYQGATVAQAGLLEVAAADALPPGGDLVLSGSALVEFRAGLGQAVQLGGLSINGGSAAPTARLDLGNNRLIVDGRRTSLAVVGSQLAAGYSGGTWDGNGIASSATSDGRTAVGYLSNGDLLYDGFGGRAVDEHSILLGYTYYGDADLSGNVTADDFDQWKGGYACRRGGWVNGDFQFSGKTSLEDFNIWKQAFTEHLLPLGTGAERPATAGQTAGQASAGSPSSATVAAVAAAVASQGGFDAWLAAQAWPDALQPWLSTAQPSTPATERALDLLLATYGQWV